MQTQRDVYKFCTNCRSDLKLEDGHKACPKCGKHYYFNPKPCVGILLSNGKGEVLLVKRAVQPFKGWWDIPGGFVEENETLEQAAHRELKEETGLEAGDLTYEGSIFDDYPFLGEAVPIEAVIFSAQVKGKATVKVADDVSDYKFMPRGEVDVESLALENQREFLRTIL